MTDELHQFLLAQFQAIRADIGTLAGNIVGLRRDVEIMREEISRHSNRIESLAHVVGNIRLDIKALAIAFDAHGVRLDRIEKHSGLDESQH
jgi:hypothetical protein